MKGYNYRLEGVQGAVLRVKLKYLEAWTEARRSHAVAYTKALADSGLGLPVEMPGNRHVYHVYAVTSQLRSELINSLNEKGIQTGVHYPTPVHLLPAYSDLGYQRGDFPISERISNEELSLPMFPEMTEEQIAAVSEAVTEFSNVCQ